MDAQETDHFKMALYYVEPSKHGSPSDRELSKALVHALLALCESVNFVGEMVQR
jgi:hypothetical protein